MKSFAAVDITGTTIGDSLEDFQTKLAGQGLSFSQYLREAYVKK